MIKKKDKTYGCESTDSNGKLEQWNTQLLNNLASSMVATSSHLTDLVKQRQKLTEKWWSCAWSKYKYIDRKIVCKYGWIIVYESIFAYVSIYRMKNQCVYR